MTTTVHSYGRFSTKRQELGDSRRRQEKMLADFLASGDYRLSDLQFMDAGKSGFSGNKQKALNEFLKILRADDGRIRGGDILFVENIDRLGRKGIKETQKTIGQIWEHGVHIAIAYPLNKIYRADTDELTDAIELATVAYTARIYSVNLSRRIKAFHEGAREVAYRTGKPIPSGAPPAWLVRLSKREIAEAWQNGPKVGFEFKPGAKEAIEYIFSRTIEGIGGKRLTKELNEKFQCFGYSEQWNERYMRAILNDRRAIGEMQPYIVDDGKRVPAGEPIQGYFPAAVDEDTWRLANAAAANRRVERGPTSQYVNLWTGLVWHAADKCPVNVYTFQQKRADGRKIIYRRLKSSNAVHGVRGASTETVYIDDFDHVVLKWLRELDTSIFAGEHSRAAELAGLVALLEKKERRIKEIESDEDGAAVQLAKQLAKLREDKKELEQQIDAIKTAQQNSTAANADHLKLLATLPDTPDNRQMLREAVKRVVARITILPVKLGSQRRSTVGSLIEVELKNGTRRQLIQAGRASVAFTESDPAGPSLYDQKDLTKRANAVKRALMLLTGGGPVLK